jgi:tungstate transport system substrate-binding protein
MLRRTHVGAVLWLIACGLIAAACGGAAPAGATAPITGAAGPAPARAELILATTTSTQDSGLLDALLPAFERQSGYHVKPVAVGSGQALKMGETGAADVLLVHSPAAEQAFMASGFGVERRLVMHNDFVIVGLAADAARITGQPALAAMRAIAAAGAPFVSRGDQSGTNALELQLWKDAGIDPTGKGWYTVAGQGMGATLNIADEKGAYTISDRATYLAFRQRLRLQVLVEKDAALLNIYHVIQVNPQRHPQANTEGGRAFAAYLLSPAGQALIGSFGLDKYGQALFTPDAGRAEDALGH